MSKHPHAENMALYAQDAMKTERPWELWEYNNGVGWEAVHCGNPTWSRAYEYRRKPSTITINGFEVPEPMREAPRIGSVYYVPIMFDRDVTSGIFTWGNITPDRSWLSRGLCHTTSEAAELHARALLSFTERKP